MLNHYECIILNVIHVLGHFLDSFSDVLNQFSRCCDSFELFYVNVLLGMRLRH
jgi:hypothetical protein